MKENNKQLGDLELEKIVGGVSDSTTTKNKTLEILKYVAIGIGAAAAVALVIGASIYGVNKYNNWKEAQKWIFENGVWKREIPLPNRREAQSVVGVVLLGLKSAADQARARSIASSKFWVSESDKRWIIDQYREQMEDSSQYIGTENVYYATDEAGIRQAIATTSCRCKERQGQPMFEVAPLETGAPLLVGHFVFQGRSSDELYVINLQQGSDSIVTDWNGVMMTAKAFLDDQTKEVRWVTDIYQGEGKLSKRHITGIAGNPFATHIEIHDFTHRP